MVGFELFGIILVCISIIWAFYKKKENVGLGLIITLLLVLILLNKI